jgi:diguanylate cyclase (GGDEF)-like protein
MPRPVEPEARSSWRALILRLGHLRSVLLIAAFSILVSMVITAVATRSLFVMTDAEFWQTMVLAAAVPGVIAPIVGHITIGLVLDLDRAQSEIAYMATRDALTGAANRAILMQRLEAEAGRHFRTGDPLTLLMVDADHFKHINDTWGHATGDRVLVAIAEVCETLMRPTDLFARYGGEEFAVLLPATNRSEGVAIGEQVRQAVADLHLFGPDGARIPVTVSVGVSVLTSPDPGCKRLFDSADSALYEAKRTGRNRCVVADRTRAA